MFKWCIWYSHQRIAKEYGGLGKNRKSGDHPNYSLVKIGQNTEKSPADLGKLVVTQTQVKNHQIKLVWKSLQRVK